MAAGDCKITIGSVIWDFSDYSPEVTWGINKNIEVFKFPGSSEKEMLDLLENEENLSISMKINTSDVTTQLNSGSSASASLKSFLTTARDTGSDPGDASTLTTLLWHTFGTFTVGIAGAQLAQRPGENTLYALDIQLKVKSGPV